MTNCIVSLTHKLPSELVATQPTPVEENILPVILSVKQGFESQASVESLAIKCFNPDFLSAFSQLPQCLIKKDATLLQLSKIMDLWNKLYHSSGTREFETNPLSKHELFAIAHYCHTALEKRREAAPMQKCHYLSKKETGLTRSIIYDSQNQYIYLTALFSKSVFKATGSAKKVVRALAASLSKQRSVKIVCCSFTKKGLTPRQLMHAQQEAGLLSLLRGVKGIAQSYTTCTVLTSLEPKQQRTSIVMEAFACDAVDAVNSRSLTTQLNLQIAKGVIYGLFYLHQKGYTHGDIKLENVLCRYDYTHVKHPFASHNTVATKTTTLIAKVADFGFAVADNQPAGNLYNEGQYGTAEYTAPELLAKKNFQGDRKKIDAFALGISLYQLFELKDVEWAADIESCRLRRRACRQWNNLCREWQKLLEKQPNDQIAVAHLKKCTKRWMEETNHFQKQLEELRKSMCEKIKKIQSEHAVPDVKIALYKARIGKGELLTSAEEKECGQWLYTNLLAVNPAERFDMARAKEEIDSLLPSFQVQ